LTRYWLGIAKKAEFRMTRARSLRVKPDGWVEEPAGIASDETAPTQKALNISTRRFW